MLGHSFDELGCNASGITLMTDDKTIILRTLITFMIGPAPRDLVRSTPRIRTGPLPRWQRLFCHGYTPHEQIPPRRLVFGADRRVISMNESRKLSACRMASDAGRRASIVFPTAANPAHSTRETNSKKPLPSASTNEMPLSSKVWMIPSTGLVSTPNGVEDILNLRDTLVAPKRSAARARHVAMRPVDGLQACSSVP